MPYVEAFIMETLRYSSLGALTFKATTCLTHFKGYTFPERTEVGVKSKPVLEWNISISFAKLVYD